MRRYRPWVEVPAQPFRDGFCAVQRVLWDEECGRMVTFKQTNSTQEGAQG